MSGYRGGQSSPPEMDECWKTISHVSISALKRGGTLFPRLHLFTPYVVYRSAPRSLISTIFSVIPHFVHCPVAFSFAPRFLTLFFNWHTLLSVDPFNRASGVASRAPLTSHWSLWYYVPFLPPSLHHMSTWPKVNLRLDWSFQKILCTNITILAQWNSKLACAKTRLTLT